MGFTLTVVGGKHHHSALGQSQLVQDSQQTAYLAVHVRDGSVVMLSYAQLERRNQSYCCALLDLLGLRPSVRSPGSLWEWDRRGS